MHRLQENKTLVLISMCATPTSKVAHEGSVYLFLDLLPKNHGFWGHLTFSHETEKEMVLRPF